LKIDPKLRAGIVAAVTAGASLTLPAPAQAGLFDFLFGGGPTSQPQQPTFSQPAIDVRVNPRRRVRSERSEKGSRRIVRAERRAIVRATPIDPVTNPNWHLEDPTLKRGDIVVLKGRVLVFEGGSNPRVSGDFTSLDKSRLVSGSDRERLKQSTGVLASAPEPATVSAALEAVE